MKKDGYIISKQLIMLFVIVIVFYLSKNYKINRIGELKTQGPLVFLLNTPLLFIGLLISITFLYIITKDKIDNENLLLSLLLFSCYLMKLCIPFYLFNGHVNYDTPLHYLSSLLLRDIGLNSNYLYHFWPLTLVQVNVSNLLTGTKYPMDASLLAITSRFLIFVIIYIIVKRFIGIKKINYLTLIILSIFEPFIFHFCPQNIAVALSILSVYNLLLLIFTDMIVSNILIFYIIYLALILSHTMFPFSITVPMFLLIILFFIDKLYTKLFKDKNKKMIITLSLVCLFVTITYNTYISFFITKRIFIIFSQLLFHGILPQLDVYPPMLDVENIKWQYNIINFLVSFIRFLILYIPYIFLSFQLFFKFLKKNIKQIQLTQIIIIIFSFINSFSYIFILFFEAGLLERFLHFSFILFTILSSIFYGNLFDSTNNKYKKIKVFLSILFVALIPISFVITPPSFTILYFWSFNRRELFSTQFISHMLSESKSYLVGDNRLIHQAFLEIYPKRIFMINIFINTTLLDRNAITIDYSYDENSVIFVNELTYLKPSWVNRLSSLNLKAYISKLVIYLNKIYDDCFNYIFIPD